LILKLLEEKVTVSPAPAFYKHIDVQVHYCVPYYTVSKND